MPAVRTINVALIGAGFMGKSHSNAYLHVNKFFDLPGRVVMHTAADSDAKRAADLAGRWGWAHATADIPALLRDPAIDLVDICTPNNAHAKLAVAAARADKAVACEKPLAHTLADAKKMAAAVARARVPNFVWFNYRRAPAVALARRLIDQGRLGTIRHFRASYLQDAFMDPKRPLVWRLRKDVAGSGSLGDLGAHLIDLARHLVGELVEVSAHCETFVKRRPLADGPPRSRRTGPVTVDDATIFLARFANGAIGTFEATRFARGRKNRNQFEVYGERGAIAFCLERMNELEYFDATEPKHVQGFRTILATEAVHPYAGAYWPPGHLTGYEHCAINQAADIVRALAGGRPRRPFRPDFADALACQEVLDAVERSHKTRRWAKAGGY